MKFILHNNQYCPEVTIYSIAQFSDQNLKLSLSRKYPWSSVTFSKACNYGIFSYFLSCANGTTKWRKAPQVLPGIRIQNRNYKI